MSKDNAEQQPPNSISDKDWKSLQDRAAKADKRHWTNPDAVKQRLQSREQRGKSRWS